MGADGALVFLTAHRQRDFDVSWADVAFSKRRKKFSASGGRLGHWQQPEASRLDLMAENVLIGPHVLQDKFRAFTFHSVEINHHEPAVLSECPTNR